MRFLRKNSDAVLNSGTEPPLLPTTLMQPPWPNIATTWLNSAPPTLSTAMSTFLGAIAVLTLLRRSSSFGSNTKSAPRCFSLAPFSALRDNATTVSPIDLPSSTDATPTPPEAPVTNSTEPARGGAGGSLHWVNACHAVRNTIGAPAISSSDQSRGMGAMLAAGITAFSARVPQVSTPALQRRMPTVSPTRRWFTPGPTARTSPTPSRPRMCGSRLGMVHRLREKRIGGVQRREPDPQQYLSGSGLWVGNFTQPQFFDTCIRIHQPCAHGFIVSHALPRLPSPRDR